MKRLLKSGMVAVAVAGVIGLGMGILTPTVGEIITQVSSQDKEALAEAERLNQQAVELYQQGKYNEAIPLAEKALAVFKKVLGENHPDTATSLNNLAEFYRSQGRYSEAEPLLKQALAIRKAQLGDNHPATANSLNNLAALYQSQGRYSEAESLYKQALVIIKAQLGDKHPDTATSLNNLATLYYSQDDIPHAIEFLSQGIAVEEYNLSENLNIGDEKQKRDYIATVSGTTDAGHLEKFKLHSCLSVSEAIFLKS